MWRKWGIIVLIVSGFRDSTVDTPIWRSITELATKIIAVTCNGNFALFGKTGDAVLAEARALVASV